MSKTRVKLADLKRVCPQDLAHCSGYVWHLNSRIGKGSFGEVYLGWTSVSCHQLYINRFVDKQPVKLLASPNDVMCHYQMVSSHSTHQVLYFMSCEETCL